MSTFNDLMRVCFTVVNAMSSAHDINETEKLTKGPIPEIALGESESLELETRYAGKFESLECMEVPPVVGRIYIVPCIVFDGSYMAVVADFHSDPDLGFAPVHIHKDMRFAIMSAIEAILDRSRPNELNVLVGEKKIFRLPMVCQREGRKYPRHAAHLPYLTEKFVGTPINCKACPHRGALLGSAKTIVVDGREIIECPGHGLRFDAITRKCVR